MATRPFTRSTTLILLAACLLIVPPPVWAGTPTGGTGKPLNVTTNNGSGGNHHDGDDDDNSHHDGDDDDNNGSTSCSCCTTLPNEVNTLKATIASLTTTVNSLKTKVNSLSTGAGCFDITSSIVRTWKVSNPATGTTGLVTFTSSGTYTIVMGTYNAGGSYAGKSTGTYQVLAGGAIAFTFTGSSTVSSIAVVQCAETSRIIHFTLGRPLDYEILTPGTLE
jgi:hypothetical protein